MHDLTAGRARRLITRSALDPVGLHEPPDGVLVAIPLYRSPELLPGLVQSLGLMADELREMGATVLFINDSPDDPALVEALAAAMAALDGMAVETVTNERNLGFVLSANRAMEKALASDRDIILLNSDAYPRPDAFAEMMAVAYSDPMIGFVSPRSDNATICNSPIPDSLRLGTPDDSFAAHKTIEKFLPRISYAPTAVGFCVYVKRLMCAEFGFFDPAYGAGYNEENDFIRRCNQCGYRAALANHAYVNHIGETSFSKSGATKSSWEAVNAALLSSRYPEYDVAVRRYFASARFGAERAAAGLVPVDGRLRILFDCRVLGSFFNGTFEHLRCLLAAFASQFADRYDIRILCEESAFSFHRLDEVSGIRRCDLADAHLLPSAVAFRMNQPDRDAMASLAGLAAITGVFMLDTISMDCQQLDESDLAGLWQGAADHSALIGFNSAFSMEQFARRFDVADDVVQFLSLCSTDVRDYADPRPEVAGGGGILLIGNHYPHKNVVEACRALRRAGATAPIVSFGLEVDEPGVAAGHPAGHIDPGDVDLLYHRADVVLFPSHYEGFGLPIMHALARRRPVIARDLPVARQIKAQCPEAINLHLYASTAEMATAAARPPVWRDPVGGVSYQLVDWESAARALADAFEEALRRFDFEACRKRIGAAGALASSIQDERCVEDVGAARQTIAELEEGIDFAEREMIRLRKDIEAYKQRDRMRELPTWSRWIGAARKAARLIRL